MRTPDLRAVVAVTVVGLVLGVAGVYWGSRGRGSRPGPGPAVVATSGQRSRPDDRPGGSPAASAAVGGNPGPSSPAGVNAGAASVSARDGADEATRAKAARLFAEGEKLLELNRMDDSFAPRSIEDVERGILNVDEALRLGFPDRKRALGALVDGYVSIAALDERRRAEAAKRLHGLYQNLQDLEPGEPRWFIDEHEMTGDPERQKAILRKGLERIPQSFEMRQMYGVILCREGRKHEGLAQFAKAAEAMTLREALDLGDGLLDYSSQCYTPGNADAQVTYDVVTRKREAAKNDPEVKNQGL